MGKGEITEQTANKSERLFLILFVLLSLLLSVNPEAYAASEGPNYAGAAGTNNWSNPPNAVGSGESLCSGGDYDATDRVGFWDTFGFSIPAGATIDGIKVEVKASWWQTAPSGQEINVGKNESTLGTATTLTLSKKSCGPAQSIITLGGTTDKWGLTWAPSDINSADFTVRINKGTAVTDIYLDWIRVTVYYNNSPPTLTVDEPDGTGDTVTVGDNYTIQYDLADSDDVVTVAFYYDTNNSGLDGTAITGACAAAAEGTNATCTWDTTGMTPGTYYVYGITDDGINPQVSDYSPGQITINAVVYQPDSMIKLSSEGDGSYLTDDTYEASASAQVKSQGVVSGSTASYSIKFQNDGNTTDSLVITGTATGSNFTVQYLDDTATDRTTDVTGAGYNISSLAAGASKIWTLNVTPDGDPSPVAGGTSYDVTITATSSNDGAKIDQVKATTSSTSANLTLVKIADKGTAIPGDEITYTVTATNGASLSSAPNVFVTDDIDANTGFKMSGATFNAGTSTLTTAIKYSNDDGSSWTYTPTDGGCSAPAGYDYCVTDVKWTMSGNMPTGTNFSIGLVVIVK
jgi:uncharacterized repeat protein (TIGR01451 family)